MDMLILYHVQILLYHLVTHVATEENGIIMVIKTDITQCIWVHTLYIATSTLR